MEKKFIVAGIISGIAIATIAIAALYVTEITKPKGVEFEWISSGPFAVQKYQHRLGENVFVVADNIPQHEKGTIRVFTPKNIEYISYPFDGSVKSSFNVYFKPDTFSRKDRCSPEDFVGVWTMRFEGVEYPPIQFEFINEYVPGAEVDIIDLCKNVT